MKSRSSRPDPELRGCDLLLRPYSHTRCSLQQKTTCRRSPLERRRPLEAAWLQQKSLMNHAENKLPLTASEVVIITTALHCGIFVSCAKQMEET